jgi:hypothetical protein
VDSKYRFTETERGFVVDAPDRQRVSVALSPSGIVLHRDAIPAQRDLGLFEYYRLSDGIARGLMNGWEPPERERRKEFPGLHEWAIRQTVNLPGHKMARWQDTKW